MSFTSAIQSRSNIFSEDTNMSSSFATLRVSTLEDDVSISESTTSSNSSDQSQAHRRISTVCDQKFDYYVWGKSGSSSPLPGSTPFLGFKVLLRGEDPFHAAAQPGLATGIGSGLSNNTLVPIGNEDFGAFKTRQSLSEMVGAAFFAVASSGDASCVIPLECLADFIAAHADRTIVCQQSSLEFHLVKQLLSKSLPATEEALESWTDIATECRMRDIFVLDTLIRLALEDGSTKPRRFGEIINQYAQFDLDSQDQSHFRYGQRHYLEPVGNKYTVEESKKPIYEESVIAFAVRDAIVLQKAYASMAHEAKVIMDLHKKEIFSTSHDLYGPLSEGIQVKGNIVLTEVTMNGIALDFDLAEKVRGKMERKLQESIKKIQQNPKWQGLFHLTIGEGGLVPVRDSGKPSIIKARLEELLIQACNEITEKYQIEITLPMESKQLSPYQKEQMRLAEQKKAEAAHVGVANAPPQDDSAKNNLKLSLSTKVWAEYAQYHPFIAAWVEMEQAAHFNAYLSHLKRPGDVLAGEAPNDGRAHPEYCVMVRNGRSAAQNPPIQQTPRKGGFREIFRASPGHVLVTVDYDFIELCTLAAVCLARYGHSTLANVIRHGVDPHAFTASMIEGVSLDEFLTWKAHQDTNLRNKFATLRQRAKAVNFGIPSGLSAAGLSMYAKAAYGVDLSKEDAEKFRTTLIEKIYPELSLYLQESDMQRLATNLKLPEDICWSTFAFNGKQSNKSPAVEGSIRNIARGKTTKKDGKEYSAFFIKKIWNSLLTLAARDPDTYNQLKAANFQGSEEIFRLLFGRPVATLTGRIRGKVGFTQACNTPFSGLAADGAKLAMWNLYLMGFTIIGFIHDEIIVEIPEKPAGQSYNDEVAEIEEIICKSMQELTGPIPISCSAAVSYVWSKNAKLVKDEHGGIVPWTLDKDPSEEDQY